MSVQWPFPAAAALVRDPATKGFPRDAYLILLDDLDLEHYRAVKVSTVRKALQCRKQSAIQALDRLVELGYLFREEGKPNQANLYKLAWGRPGRVSQTVPSRAS